MGIDFRFYLNSQGIQGQRGQRGEQGFSPLISVKTQTASEYVLTVQNEDGSFDTPNLKSWMMGCPRTPPEVFEKLRKMKAELNEAIKAEKEKY